MSRIKCPVSQNISGPNHLYYGIRTTYTLGSVPLILWDPDHLYSGNRTTYTLGSGPLILWDPDHLYPGSSSEIWDTTLDHSLSGTRLEGSCYLENGFQPIFYFLGREKMQWGIIYLEMQFFCSRKTLLSKKK